MRKKYPWPCSKLDRDLMHELHVESVFSAVPISAIVAEAVSAYLNAKLEQRQSSSVSQHAI